MENPHVLRKELADLKEKLKKATSEKNRLRRANTALRKELKELEVKPVAAPRKTKARKKASGSKVSAKK